jgi:predicted transcriptional regulator
MDELLELAGEERRRFLSAIEEGLRALDRGETVPHEEVVRDLERKFGFTLRPSRPADSP